MRFSHRSWRPAATRFPGAGVGLPAAISRRPGIAVRSLVRESSFLSYWSLDDACNLQYGAGGEGDLPNDIKLQFGGLVLRGPTDWTETEGWVTVWFPGFLIEDRPLAIIDNTISYRFDPSKWRHDFPNIDRQPVDTFVVTLSVSGLDPDGQRRTRARLIVFQGRQVLASPGRDLVPPSGEH